MPEARFIAAHRQRPAPDRPSVHEVINDNEVVKFTRKLRKLLLLDTLYSTFIDLDDLGLLHYVPRTR